MRWKILGLCALGLAAAACEQQGPAEQAGERIDEAVEDVRDSAENLGDQARELVDETAERLERPQAGE